MLTQSTAAATQAHVHYTDIDIPMPTELLPRFPIASINHTHRVPADLFAFLSKIFYPDHPLCKSMHCTTHVPTYRIHCSIYPGPMDTRHILFCLYMDSSPLVRFPSRHPPSPLMIFYVHIPLHARSTSHVQLLFYIVIVLWWWLLNLIQDIPRFASVSC